MSSFYMVLPSNSCPNTRPNNSANNFTIDYENAINLHGDWEVAMTDILLLYCPLTIKKGATIKYQTSSRRKHEMYVKDKKLVFFPHFPEITDVIYDKKVFWASLTKKIAITFKSMSDANACGFDKLTIRYDKSIMLTLEDSMKKPIEFDLISWEDKDETYVFEHDMYVNNANDIVDYFNKNCSQIFKSVKVDSNIFSWELQDIILKAETSPQLAIALGLKDSILSKIGNGERMMKLNSGFNQIYIYSSIVDPIMVGSDRVPLLRCTWIDTTKYKGGDFVFLTINNPMYLPVSSSCINKIEVNIRDDSGELLNFNYGAKTILTLHFRKKRND